MEVEWIYVGDWYTNHFILHKVLSVTVSVCVYVPTYYRTTIVGMKVYLKVN